MKSHLPGPEEEVAKGIKAGLDPLLQPCLHGGVIVLPVIVLSALRVEGLDTRRANPKTTVIRRSRELATESRADGAATVRGLARHPAR